MPPDQLAERLRAEVSAVGVELSPDRIAALIRFLDLVQTWRSRAGLTAVRDPLRAARVHVADSLLCLRAAIPHDAALVDVGSGAGLPGIPLAIVRPDLRASLLEADARKAAFLELAVRELGLTARVILARAEDAAHADVRERADVVTARAVAPLATLLELTLPFARVGGQVVLLKGPGVRREMRGAEGARRILGGGEMRMVEGRLAGGEGRLLVIVPKVAPTPEQYPRRAGVPRRKPL